MISDKFSLLDYVVESVLRELPCRLPVFNNKYLAMERKRHKGRDAHSRLHINCFSIVFSCLVLIAANSVVRGHFTDRINKISRDLNTSLGALMDNQVTNYTSIYQNVTYVSVNNFNSRGMSGLYNITTSFMDLIASKDIYPDGLIKVENQRLKLGSFEEQWQSILSHYGALLAILILLLLFAVLMPICGFFFCCCRCCGKCGARSKPFDKKGDLCKKICLASLLICIGTLLLFGVVCAFVTNQTLQDNTYELSPSFKNGIQDTHSYLNYTSRQLHVLLTINYNEFENRIFTTLHQCSDIVYEQLGEYSNATSLSEVVGIVDGLDDIKSNLTFIKESTHVLRINATQLNSALRKVKGDLLQILKACGGIPDCDKISNEYINALGTDIHFDQLPNIDSELDKLNELLETNIKNAIKEGEIAFEKIKNEINGTVNKELPKVESTITKVGLDIMKYERNISSVVSNALDNLHKYLDPSVSKMDEYIKEYTPYRYYLGVAISCILLLVSLCITLGLICGICGKRPDAYGDDCCNKGAGSRFLMLGVAIMFLFSIVLAAVAIVYFFTGILAQRLACDSLRNPKGSQVIRLVDEVFNLKQKIGVDANLTFALTAIHSNKSLYHTFDLKTYFDLDKVEDYMKKFEIKEMLDELKRHINANTTIELISSQAEERLNELVDSGIDKINYDTFIDELTRALTTVDLALLASKLEELVNTVNTYYPKRRDISTSLMLSSLHLRTYQANLVEPMRKQSNHLIEAVRTLQSSFSSATIKQLIKDLKVAEDYLQNNGPTAILDIADSFAGGLEKQVRSYLDRAIMHVKDDLGHSEPISRVFNATMVATCDKILLPWNGFWFSILWCLVLFIPAIILSVKLAGLYQKYEAYPGPLVEAEYLYDAYADRDNIPLNSSLNDKRLKKKKKHKRFDGRGAYVAEPPGESVAVREVPSGSARYADMAPKHWEEFPAGGPPHYQRAPTEYERPPPYYYPTTGEQQ